LWSSRELRGRIERVVRETDDASTLVIRPGWGWHFEPKPGQYIGIGVDVDGRFHWRSYSLSAPPRRDGRDLAITVRAMPEGFLSQHLVDAAPGTIVRLAAPAGDFVLPAPPPAKLLFFVGGSGITPVMAMLRTLDRRGSMPDTVLVYSSPTPERMIFRDELVRMAERHAGLHLHEQHTDLHGMFSLQQLDKVCPDWQERETWACGPTPMLDSAEQHWEDAGLADQLHVERFTLELAADGEAGGHVTFQNSGKETEADGATTVLEAGEQAGVGMPYGCRMGICHTCTLTMISGKVRDLRNGEEHSEPNEPVQTCVTVAVGDVVLNI
jgi:ferredoxin-NADP reductase